MGRIPLLQKIYPPDYWDSVFKEHIDKSLDIGSPKTTYYHKRRYRTWKHNRKTKYKV